MKLQYRIQGWILEQNRIKSGTWFKMIIYFSKISLRIWV